MIRLAVIPLLCAGLLLGAPIASAQAKDAPAASAKKISLEFRGTLRDALKQIASKGGLNLVVTGDLSQDAEVYLKDISAEEALRTVAAAYNLKIQQTGTVWTLRPLTAMEMAGVQAPVPPVPPQRHAGHPPEPPSAPAPLENVEVPSAPPVPGIPPIPAVTPEMDERQLDQVMRMAEEAAERAADQADAIAERVAAEAEAAIEAAQEKLETAKESAAAARERTGATAEEAVARAKEEVARAKEEVARAREQAEQARERAKEEAERAREQARETREQAREAAREARQRIRELKKGKNARAGIAGPISCNEGEVVDSMVAFGSPIDVNCHVLDDVASFGGPVTLGPKAWVEGDVVSFGGPVTRDDGAVVDGKIESLGGPVIGKGIAGAISAAKDRKEREEERDDEWSPFAASIVWFIVLFGIGFLASLLIPSRMKLVESDIRSNPLMAGLVGILGALALAPLTLLLIVTVVGIPVAAALWLLVPLAVAVGFTAVASEIGMRLPIFRGRKTQALVLALGLVLLLLVANVPVLGVIAMVALGFIGFGAVVRTRFGSRPAGPKPVGPSPSSDIPTGVPV